MSGRPAARLTAGQLAAIAAVLKVMTETLEQIRPEGVPPVDEQTTGSGVPDGSGGARPFGATRPTDHAPAAPAPLSRESAVFVTLDALATRWGIGEAGVRSRLGRREIAIVRDPLGRPAAREADLAGHDFGQRQRAAPGNGHAPAEPAPSAEPAAPFVLTVQRRHDAEDATRAEPAAPAPAAPAERPPVLAPLYGNDAGRVRRLLLALAKIRALAATDDVHPALAIAALAGYAIEAES